MFGPHLTIQPTNGDMMTLLELADMYGPSNRGKYGEVLSAGDTVIAHDLGLAALHDSFETWWRVPVNPIIF